MSLRPKLRAITDPVKAYLLWAAALAYLLLSTTLYSYVKEFFGERPPLFVVLVSMTLIFYPSLRLIRYGAMFYWRRAVDQSAKLPKSPHVSGEKITPAEHGLYRMLLVVRIGSVIALLMFLGFALYGKLFSNFENGSVAILALTVAFLIFLDGLVSYMQPRLAARIPANALLAYIFQSSLFNKTGKKASFVLIFISLTTVVFIVVTIGQLQ